MKSGKLLIAAGFVLITVIWGTTWLAIKIGLDSVPPLFGVALRFTVAMIILTLIAHIRGEKLPTDRTALRCYLTLALISFSFPFALVYWGEQHVSSGLAAILFALYPFVVAVQSHFFLPDERLNGYTVVGIVLGFIGVLIIFWTEVPIRQAAPNVAGMSAILISTILQGTALVTIKRIGNHLSPTAMSLGGIIGAVVILYLMAFSLESPADIHFDAKGIGSILYLGTLGTVVTFLTYYWLLKRVAAVMLSLVALVTPVLAVIVGVVLLDENPEPRIFFGAGSILLGILIANSKELHNTIQTRRERIPS